MDISAITSHLPGNTLWYLLPLPLLVWALFSRWFKGLIGGVILDYLAEHKLDKETYTLIKHAHLPTEEGSVQIDHLIVSLYGVFVVETRNLRGCIFGGKHTQTWTQRVYNRTNKFPNPLRQTQAHAKSLADLLGLSEHQVHPLVIFIGGSKFKTEMPDNVTQGMGYIRYIHSKQELVLSGRQVREIIVGIESGRLEQSFQYQIEQVGPARRVGSQDTDLPTD